VPFILLHGSKNSYFANTGDNTPVTITSKFIPYLQAAKGRQSYEWYY
jgi:hypothetical protein